MKKASEEVLTSFIAWYNGLSVKRAFLNALIHAAGFEAGKDYDMELIDEKKGGLSFTWWKLKLKEGEGAE